MRFIPRIFIGDTIYLKKPNKQQDYESTNSKPF